MNEGIITSRYTKALFQTAEESGTIESVYNDINTLLKTINESPEFKEFLNAPILKNSQKIKILTDIFKGKIEELTFKFLLLLVNNKREQYLPSICLHFLQLYKQTNKIVEGVLITAHPLEREFSREIVKYIHKKFKLEIDFSEQVDQSIIGGFKLRIDDKQIDASIASKIKKIKSELINS